MKKNILPLLFLLGSTCAKANEYTIASPDGRLKVVVECRDGRATYAVSYDGRQMLCPSNLGLVADYGDFTQGLTMGALSGGTTVHLAYDLRQGKKSHIEHDAVQAAIGFTNAQSDSMTLHLHLSANDLAFRYTLHRPKAGNPQVAVVKAESTAFRFPSGTTTFLCPQITAMGGWQRTKPSYEEEYTADAPMAAKSQYGVGYTFPCLFRRGDDGWVMVSETGVGGNYCGSRLSDYSEATGYTIAYPQPGENNSLGSSEAGIPLPGSTPWRTVTVGSTLAPVAETTVMQDVVEPLYAPSRQYEPARYTWSWLVWQDESINYDDQLALIDVAAAQGYEAVLVDDCWDVNIGRDRIEQLSRYAQSKGVKLMLWYNSNGAENDAPQTPKNIMNNAIARKKEMAWLKQIGVVGIKVDFFGGDKQCTMQLYEDILSDANDYGLQVIFHGCTMPRGWERMYPNYAASEAALASENVFFTEHHAREEAFQMTMHPFGRNAQGSFDWGGVIMNHYLSRDNASRHRRYTGDVFEMATAITNQSSINCVCLYPNNLQGELAQWQLSWLKGVPTAWDDMQLIDGYPTRYAVVARRASAANRGTAAQSVGRWYVGGINATSAPLTLTLSLPMFAGQTVEYLVDMPAAKGSEFLTPTKRTLKVGKDGKARVTIQPKGGIIID